MAEPRQYPGELLVERLFARGERRVRVGVSSAFFARFGLDNPWDLDSTGPGWGDHAWGFGRRRGVLGSFRSLFQQRFLGHLMGGVLFRGGLGLSLHHPWADWLPYLGGAESSWLWRDRTLAAWARMPGSGLRRPLPPWGAYSSPGFSFLLPELEEIEPEEPSARPRFRRRPRRARRAQSPSMALPAAAPHAEPLPAAAGARIRRPDPTQPLRPARSARPIGVDQPPPAFIAPPQHAQLPPERDPGPGRRPSAALPGLARVLQRQQAPVGTPSLRRALERSASGAQPSPFATLAPQPALAAPALQGPVAWAETRLQQAEQTPTMGRPRALTPAAATVGAPPTAARSLFPVLFRSPSLRFLAPEPEADELPQDEPAAAPARRRTPARPVRRRPVAAQAEAPARTLPVTEPTEPSAPTPRPLRSVERPAAPPARVERRDPVAPSAAPVAATARIAERLATFDDLAPAAEQPYRALRRASALPAPDSADTPLLRAVARSTAPATDDGPATDAPGEAASSLDRLLQRPTSAPGLPGRVAELERRAPGAAMERGLPAALVRSARPASPFQARSPMLAFLDAVESVEDEQAQPAEQRVRPPARERARAARAARATPEATRPLRQVASRALLRAEQPAPGRGSVLPRPVTRAPADRALTPLSSTAFPGRRQLHRVQRAAVEQASWTEPTARTMRVPWLPVDRLVLPPEPVDELDDDPTGAAPRTRRPDTPARRRAARRRAEPAPSRPVSAAAPRDATPAMRASARAAARLAEIEAPPAPRPSARPARIIEPAAPTAARRPAATPGVTPISAAPARPVPGVEPRPPRGLAAARPADPAPPRSSGTQRALHRLIAPSVGGPAAVAADAPGLAAPPVLSRQAWAFVRAPSTVWLHWREPDQLEDELPASSRWAPAVAPTVPRQRARAPGAAPDAPAPRTWSPVSRAVAAPIRAARAAESAAARRAVGLPAARAPRPWSPMAVSPRIVPLGPGEPAPTPRAPSSGRALPSGRALRRLSPRSRVQQRAAAVAGGLPAPAPASVPRAPAPRAALVRPTPTARPAEPSAAAPRSGVTRPALRRARAGDPPTIRVSAIDKLLSEGVGAQVIIPALSRVDRPDEALRIVLERTLGWRGRGTLPAPVRQLVEQVQAAAEPGTEPSRRRPTPSRPRREALRRRRPAARRRRDVAAPATKAAATVHHVQAHHRIRGLVKKLEQLIHLVDVEHRLAAARSQVRLAEDSPAARSPGSPDQSPDAAATQAGQDVDSLVQHIVEFVNEEMSLFAMRRPEDPGNRTPWF